MILRQDGSVWSTAISFRGSVPAFGVGNHLQKAIASGAIAVAAGSSHSLVVKKDGSVWATGRNTFGQLGDGSVISKANFVPVVPSGAQAVAAGGGHSMVLMLDGSFRATGENEYGQLGDGSTISKNSFFKISLGKRDGSVPIRRTNPGIAGANYLA